MALSEKGLVYLCHLTALLGFVVPGANVLGPLVFWLLNRHKSALVDNQGLESLNFQISMTVLFVFSFFLRQMFFGKTIMMALALIDFGFIFYALLMVFKQGRYRYPFNFRIVK
jgi:uncharacterized protein